jgi:hypothetical protein
MSTFMQLHIKQRTYEVERLGGDGKEEGRNLGLQTGGQIKLLWIQLRELTLKIRPLKSTAPR